MMTADDYRGGNFPFDEDRGKITAWLDWEGVRRGPDQCGFIQR
jgi:aminoglycoside phosphotransferase (APT) family kinase protein